MPSGEASAGRHNLVTVLILAVVLLIVVGATSAATVHAHNHRKHQEAATPPPGQTPVAPGVAGSPSAELKKIYQATVAAGTVYFTESETFTRNGEPGTVMASGQDSYDRRDAVLSQVVTTGGKTVDTETLYVGDQDYISVPAAERATVSSGKPWLRYTGLTPLETSIFPTDPILLLEADATAVQRIGPSTVGGVSTTRYQATISTAQKPAYSSLLNGLVKEFSSEFQVESVPVTVWADAQGRIRQLQVALHGVSDSETETIQLSRYGAPVDVNAPPGAQVDVKAAPTT